MGPGLRRAMPPARVGFRNEDRPGVAESIPARRDCTCRTMNPSPNLSP